MSAFHPHESDYIHLPVVGNRSGGLGGTVQVLCIAEFDLNSVLLDSVDLGSNGEHT